MATASDAGDDATVVAALSASPSSVAPAARPSPAVFATLSSTVPLSAPSSPVASAGPLSPGALGLLFRAAPVPAFAFTSPLRPVALTFPPSPAAPTAPAALAAAAAVAGPAAPPSDGPPMPLLSLPPELLQPLVLAAVATQPGPLGRLFPVCVAFNTLWIEGLASLTGVVIYLRARYGDDIPGALKAVLRTERLHDLAFGRATEDPEARASALQDLAARLLPLPPAGAAPAAADAAAARAVVVFAASSEVNDADVTSIVLRRAPACCDQFLLDDMLRSALRGDRAGVAQVLLEGGADLRAVLRVRQMDPMTAIEEGQLATAEVLLNHGEMPARQWKQGRMLNLACKAAAAGLIRAILRHGAPILKLQADEFHVYNVAAASAGQDAPLQALLEGLRERGAEALQRMMDRALQRAMDKGALEAASILVRTGADGGSIFRLHYLVIDENADRLELLRQAGCDLTELIRSHWMGRSITTAACQQQHRMLAALVRLPGVPEFEIKKALHFARREGNEEAAELLTQALSA